MIWVRETTEKPVVTSWGVCAGEASLHGMQLAHTLHVYRAMPPMAGDGIFSLLLQAYKGIRIFSLTSSNWDMATAPVWQDLQIHRTLQDCDNSQGHEIEWCL